MFRDVTNGAISQTGASIAHRPAPLLGYSVCYRFAREYDSKTVWGVPQEKQRVLWLIYYCIFIQSTRRQARLQAALRVFSCQFRPQTPDMACGLAQSTLRYVSRRICAGH